VSKYASILGSPDNESLEILRQNGAANEVVEMMTELKFSEAAARPLDGEKENWMEKKKSERYF
jgi:hypothetical protein